MQARKHAGIRKLYVLIEFYILCFNLIIQGSPQWIQITPTRATVLNSIAIKFQGGFAAKRFVVESRQDDGTFTAIAEFYPDDHGKLQISFFFLFLFIFFQHQLMLFNFLNVRYLNVFQFPTTFTTDQRPFRLTFYDSYDTFGRIIIYILKLFENKSN